MECRPRARAPWNRSRNGTGPSVRRPPPSRRAPPSAPRRARGRRPRGCGPLRTRSSSRAVCQVARSTTGGRPQRGGRVVWRGRHGVLRVSVRAASWSTTPEQTPPAELIRRVAPHGHVAESSHLFHTPEPPSGPPSRSTSRRPQHDRQARQGQRQAAEFTFRTLVPSTRIATEVALSVSFVSASRPSGSASRSRQRTSEPTLPGRRNHCPDRSALYRSTQPGEIPCWLFREHLPKCRRGTTTGWPAHLEVVAEAEAHLSSQPALAMNPRVLESRPPSRRSASVCARDGGACTRSPAGFLHGRGSLETSLPSRLASRCSTWTASCCPDRHPPRPRGRRNSGPGPTLASEAANRSRRVLPTASICRSLALKLLMFGSRGGGG